MEQKQVVGGDYMVKIYYKGTGQLAWISPKRYPTLAEAQSICVKKKNELQDQLRKQMVGHVYNAYGEDVYCWGK